MDDVKQFMGLIVPLMTEAMAQNMATATLRELFHRQPSTLEVSYYLGQLWLRELVRWQQERQSSYQGIHDLVWG